MKFKLLTMLLLTASTTACGIAKDAPAKGTTTAGETAAPAEVVSTAATASGSYDADGQKFTFAHVVALRIDDAEGMSVTGPGIRVLLSDVEVPKEAIEGSIFPPVTTMAREGKVSGLLLDFDPTKPEAMQITILDGHAVGSGKSSSISLQSTDLWSKFEVKGDRITAVLKDRPDMKFSFSAPIQADPVKDDFKGISARANSITALLKSQAEAIGRGDIPAISANMSKRRKPEVDNAPPGMANMMKQQAPMMLASIGQIDRLIVRENRATATGPNGFSSSFVREDGGWKID